MNAPRATSDEDGNVKDGKGISRRGFLKVSGALGLAGGMAGCVNLKGHDVTALPQEKPPVPGSDKWYRGEERMIASACAQCSLNCGISVRVVEGRAVRINGNPKSILVGGKLGPKGQTGHFTLYDPDRVRGPMKRDGERGSGKWKPVSWEEALTEVTGKLGDLRGRAEPHRLAVFCGRQRGFMKELLERFCRSYGTPNFYDPLSTNDGALAQAMQMMMGVGEIPGYDASNTSYILSLGAGIFESTCNGIHFIRAAKEFRRGHPSRRSKIVQVEPNRSLSAAAADEWFRIKPGTYDVLALGLAHLLVKEDRYDRDFVAKHTTGFAEFREVLQAYPPEKVAGLTGMPEDILHQLAWELTASRPSLVLVDTRSVATSNGLEIARCALALNALLGSVERAGGLVGRKPIPLAPWPEAAPDAIAAAGLAQPALDGRGRDRCLLGTSSVEDFPEAVLAGKPYGVEALFLYYSNPLFARNRHQRFAEAFARIPYIVSFSPFLDESAYQADLILPDHTFLERWEEALPPPFGFQGAMGLRRPVVEPLYDTQHSGDFLIKLAKGLGGPVASAFPWKGFKAAMEERLGGLSEAGRGSIKAGSRDEFLKKLAKDGYWNDEPAAPGSFQTAFPTPSGKFEFYSAAAEAGIKAMAAARGATDEEVLRGLGKEAMGDACLPRSAPPRFAGSEAEYPLVFSPYKDITYAEGSGMNIPYLKELSGLQRGFRAVDSWRSYVEIHYETAAALGIGKDDPVWVESPLGKLKAFAKLSGIIPEDMAFMEMGKGHTQYGRFARGKGENPKSILSPATDPFSGHSPRCNTRVRITKA